MNELVIAVVAQELKANWESQIGDIELLQLLYGSVVYPTDLHSSGEIEQISIDKTKASRIMNRKKGGNVHRTLRKASKDPRVTNSIDEYFQRNIVKRLLPDRIDDLILTLKEIIINDGEIKKVKRAELLSLAKKETIAAFLASVFCYTITRDNVIKEELPRVLSDKEKDALKHLRLKSEIPTDIDTKENRYVGALMEVYKEMTGKESLTAEVLSHYPEQHRHFLRQRNDYWAAEAVRRGTRDAYGVDEEDHFEVLMEDTFNGIIDTYEREKVNGYVRLSKVLEQASQLSVNQCWLSRDTVWIGNSQKKGVCHVLVNESWLDGWVVKKDDGETV